jgi:hypothetical protein
MAVFSLLLPAHSLGPLLEGGLEPVSVIVMVNRPTGAEVRILLPISIKRMRVRSLSSIIRLGVVDEER